MSNPSIENIIKTVTDIELDESDDADIKEIKQMMGDIMTKDLKIDSPWEMINFGIKMASDSDGSKMQGLTQKI